MGARQLAARLTTPLTLRERVGALALRRPASGSPARKQRDYREGRERTGEREREREREEKRERGQKR